MYCMGINLRIKEVRQTNKMNKKEFSSFLKIDNSQYSKIELGKLMPTVSQLVEISSKFNVSLDWLITGSGEKPMILGGERGETTVKAYELPISSGNIISEPGSEYLTRYEDQEREINYLKMRVESLENTLKEKQLIIDEKDAIIHEKNEIIETLKSAKTL